MSIIAAGGIFTGTNPAYTPHELAHTIKTANVTWLMSEPELLEPLHAAAKTCGIPKSKIWIFHPLSNQKCTSGYMSWEELFRHGEEDWVRFDDLETCRNTTAMRLFSSGTTGLPKAVNMSHYNFIAQHELIWEGPSAKRDWDEVFLFPLPMFHAAIAPRAHISTFRRGDRTYIMRRFELEQFLANIEKFSVTGLSVVPPMAIAIIMSPLNKKYSLKSIRWSQGGAAPMGPETQARLQALLNKDTPFTQVWGMTEASCIVTRFEYPERDVTGAVGRPIPNVDMKLVDDDGKDLGEIYGTRGEICVRGPTIVPGYHDNPKANAESFDADGFYHTGDIGYCDANTKLWYIVDRKKELIKVRAFQVAPTEIETILLDHPSIVDCAVIGIESKQPGEEHTELPRAYVVRRPGTREQDLTEDMVKEYVKPKLARYKWLEGAVRFVEVIPKSANGKILKRILKEEAKNEMASAGKSKL
jgi:4-coumarate--CoA ligase